MFLDHITLLQYAATEQQSTAWTKEDSASMQVWWHDFQAYVESETAQGERRMSNNHGSWYDADWLSVALFNGDVKQGEKLNASSVPVGLALLIHIGGLPRQAWD
jgi:hypothetical protein